MFSSFFDIYQFSPPGDHMHKIILTDENSLKFYVYWRIFYEEINEDFLMLQYDKIGIKDVHKISTASEVLHSTTKIIDQNLLNLKTKKGRCQTLDTEKTNKNNSLHFKGEFKKFGEEDDIGFQMIEENQQEGSINRLRKFYAPIAICVKTYIEDEDAITSFMDIQFDLINGFYQEHYDYDDKIKLYCKLASTIFFSIFIIKPPLYTDFIFQIDKKAIILSEESNMEYYCPNDITILVS